MKFLFDIFPVILFFIAYKISGIYVATAVAIIATIVQIAWAWLKHKKIDGMQWVSLGIIVIFGGATLILHEELFIKWKPTVLYWLFAATLIIAALVFKKNLIRSMMEAQIQLPEPIWTKLNWSWAGFFILMGSLNLWIALHFSTETWVNFKLFGGIGLMLLFVLIQGIILSRHIPSDSSRPPHYSDHE